MKIKIYWRILINTKSDTKVKKLISKIHDILGEDCELIKSEKYWKDNSLYELEFNKSLLKRIPEEIIFEIMNIISKISNSWRISIPSNLSENYDEISGFTDEKIKIGGLKWISFILQIEE